MSVTQGDTKSDFGGDYTGYTAQVVEDIEWVVDDCAAVPTDGDLAEWTYDWFMQDEYQNIWYLGEDTRSFDEGCPSIAEVPLGTADWSIYGYGDAQAECTAGSWEAGQPGPDEGLVGEAGIVVPGDMPTGDEPLTPGTFYMQELAEGAEDMAKILRLNATVSVDEGQFAGNEYENCRMVKEWTGLEPGASVEHKFYCAGPGLLLVEGIGGGPTEAEVLVEVTQTP